MAGSGLGLHCNILMKDCSFVRKLTHIPQDTRGILLPGYLAVWASKIDVTYCWCFHTWFVFPSKSCEGSRNCIFRVCAGLCSIWLFSHPYLKWLEARAGICISLGTKGINQEVGHLQHSTEALPTIVRASIGFWQHAASYDPGCGAQVPMQ